jgi:hypothetical protein
MDRLDAVVGPENWKDEYYPSPLGNGFECRLSIRLGDGSWVTKVDGAEPTQIESIKGAYSDSLKRAAVKWGIGRYLYRLPLVWVPIEAKGQIYVSSKSARGYANPPALPEWALPITYQNKPVVSPGKEAPTPAPTQPEPQVVLCSSGQVRGICHGPRLDCLEGLGQAFNMEDRTTP